MDSKEFEITVKKSRENLRERFLGQVLDDTTIDNIVALVTNNTIDLMLKMECIRAVNSKYV